MSSGRTLEQWLTLLERRHPVAIDMGLDRIRVVADRLGLTDRPIADRVVTVAGTNGKGSTVAMLNALASHHGLRCAVYTSPHLLHYNERIRLSDGLVRDAELVRAFEAIDDACGETSLTYFEAGTLAALWLIQQDAPDIAVLEVGLGGRLDAVNLVDADVAVVTTVAQDHADYLGNDLQNIGREKAGIMRAGRPAVLGSEHLPSSVAAHAEEIGAVPVYCLGQDFRRTEPDGEFWHWQGRDTDGERVGLSDLPDPGLPLDNAATALQALMLADVSLTASAVEQAFKQVELPGRMQWLHRAGRQWCLDVAHNPHAAEYLAQRLCQRPPGHRICILAMLGDKDAEGVIRALMPVVDEWRVAGLPGERARDAASLALEVQRLGGHVTACHETPGKAVSNLLASSDHPSADVLVCGSFFTVADALAVMSTTV
ncbi:bifunctional tetrahydrofolate synthase/dihydrofolate synthase [Larsenimonas rhizosphaerae]|uniref:bifunctional tetrahydrofolate synthase/dihydrofolate synthase n=1 Tax=Larsenimonas rhizosphaerae TaxID=2944682 RepID=UPI00203358AB|nr:bifunctional tetrahydrofolate synthase/dihydrofolate synthase [Larsenimonas rhizosphaerae]MCM2130588.1 bifunctional tetrahydrofolate synthase/dihydrofolate synthase [Larsenimonas rhizosphaerae]